jgi:hypothetical protein
MPDSVGVRNFVLGAPLRLLPELPLVLHPFKNDQIERIGRSAGTEAIWQETLGEADNHLVTVLLRQSLGSAHKNWANTKAMRYSLTRPVRGSWRGRGAALAAQRIGRVFGSKSGIHALERIYHYWTQRSEEYFYYLELFKRRRPKVLLCTAQEAPEVLASVLAAKSLGITTVAFIVSWDNLTSKSRISAPFDHYLVWGDQMRSDLMAFYPEVRASQIHIGGSPQFDWYADRSLLQSRQDFCRQLGADPARPLVCYSGGDLDTCPEDPGHVRILMELIRAGLVQGSPQVILRPSPADDGSRYKEVLASYPELVYSPPRWQKVIFRNRTRSVPKIEDVHLLANLTYHSDVNVNLASTMTLDFSINDTPVVNIGFDVNKTPNGKGSLCDHYYTWDHYLPVITLRAARLARSPEELAQAISNYLRDPSLDREGRRRLVQMQLGVPVGQSSSNLAERLKTLAGLPS